SRIFPRGRHRPYSGRCIPLPEGHQSCCFQIVFRHSTSWTRVLAVLDSVKVSACTNTHPSHAHLNSVESKRILDTSNEHANHRRCNSNLGGSIWPECLHASVSSENHLPLLLLHLTE